MGTIMTAVGNHGSLPTTKTLGRLERVDLREIWPDEAKGFTTWLAREENIALLGNTVGLELEVEAKEKEVGPFRADILCKDTATDHWVLIENQLERTDHTHLGQLLTYAAGLQAVTIAWIAKRFTDEHRAALDWLNEITDDRFNFFGLELELWRIGDSKVAPKFNIVCKPNDWSKQIVASAARMESEALTDTKRLQLEFWTAFAGHLDKSHSKIKATKPRPQHWMNFALGRSGFHLSAIASMVDSVEWNFENQEVRAELGIQGENSKTYFRLLEAEKKQIEKEVGEGLTWRNPEEVRTCRIYLRRPADLNDRSQWPEYHAWLGQKLELLRNVFGPRVKMLDLVNSDAEVDGTSAVQEA